MDTHILLTIYIYTHIYIYFLVPCGPFRTLIISVISGKVGLFPETKGKKGKKNRVRGENNTCNMVVTQ